MSFTMESPSLSGRRVTEDDLPFVLGVWNDERVAATVGGRTSESELTDRLRAWSQHWDLHGFGTTSITDVKRRHGGVGKWLIGLRGFGVNFLGLIQATKLLEKWPDPRDDKRRFPR